jgi:hypothetical protein
MVDKVHQFLPRFRSGQRRGRFFEQILADAARFCLGGANLKQAAGGSA